MLNNCVGGGEQEIETQPMRRVLAPSMGNSTEQNIAKQNKTLHKWVVQKAQEVRHLLPNGMGSVT